MDILDLKTFAAVAEQGGITGASRQLHTVQSNVTQRIQALEAELGLALFARHSRGMSLTRAGQRLLPYATRAALLLREAEAAARGEAPLAASLAIGSMETTTAIRLPPLLAAFRRQQPQVSLSLETRPTARLLDAVLERRLDGAFVAGPIDNPALEIHVAFEEELVLVSATRWARLQDLGRCLDEGGAAIMFKLGCSYRQRFEQVLSELGWPGFSRLEMGTLDGILGCVGADVGISLLPRAVVANATNAAALACHPLEARRGLVQTLFVRRKDEPPSEALNRFLSLL